MQTTRNFTAITALVASLLGFAGASQAVTLTVGAAWDPTAVAGSSTVGRTYTAASAPLNAISAQSWDTLTDVGVTRTFTFSQPFSVTVLDTTALGLDFHFYATTVTFSGAGTAVAHSPFTTPLFTQGLYSDNLGSSVKLGYAQQGTVEYSSDFGGQHLEWTAHFVTQPIVEVAYTNGSASYTWNTVSLDVTLLSAVPEAGTAAMLALGLLPLAIGLRRRRG
jgi:hypothetical protein